MLQNIASFFLCWLIPISSKLYISEKIFLLVLLGSLSKIKIFDKPERIQVLPLFSPIHDSTISMTLSYQYHTFNFYTAAFIYDFTKSIVEAVITTYMENDGFTAEFNEQNWQYLWAKKWGCQIAQRG